MTFSAGVRVPSYPYPAFVLRDNTIHGGSNQYCKGIELCAAGCVIVRNRISGGGSTGETPSSTTQAIQASEFTLADNMIDGGIGAAWAHGLTVTGNRATITGNRFTTPRGVWHDCISPGTGVEHVIHGNTLHGIPDDDCFAWAAKLERRTWRSTRQPGRDWSWQEVELVPRGWLEFATDSAVRQEQSNSVGPAYGPSLTFGTILRDGPPATENMPPTLVDELRSLLTAAGCTLEALEALASLDARAQRDVLSRGR